MHRGEYLHVVDGVEPIPMARHEFRAQLDQLAHAVLGVGRGDERQIAPRLRTGHLRHGRRQRWITGIDRVRCSDYSALLLLPIYNGKWGDGELELGVES